MLYLLILIPIIIFFIYLFCFCSKKNFTIKKSKIHNQGLFSNKNFKKNDILIENLFPYTSKTKNPKNNFDEVIIKEGKFINHCKNLSNTDVIFKNNKYSLISTEDINKNDEILSDYDKIHKKFNFIAGSKKNYKSC